MEDRPRYVAAAAPATPRLSAEFRSMLHKIHRGSDLPDAATYGVVGFGAGAYPNNFGVVTFSDVEFPAMPAGVKDCRACHGTSDAWQSPADRSHPTAATVAGALLDDGVRQLPRLGRRERAHRHHDEQRRRGVVRRVSRPGHRSVDRARAPDQVSRPETSRAIAVVSRS